MDRKHTFTYTNEEIVAIVNAKSGGGAYVNVPSQWIGGQVKIMLLGTNTVYVDLSKQAKKPDKNPQVDNQN